MSTVLVEYVGLKPQETDCVAGTGLVWVGQGAVHEVPVKAWAVMAQHPDVWALVPEPASIVGLINAKPPAKKAKPKATSKSLADVLPPEPGESDGEGDTPDVAA